MYRLTPLSAKAINKVDTSSVRRIADRLPYTAIVRILYLSIEGRSAYIVTKVAKREEILKNRPMLYSVNAQ